VAHEGQFPITLPKDQAYIFFCLFLLSQHHILHKLSREAAAHTAIAMARAPRVLKLHASVMQQ
jgi:hypothetical protein